MYVITEKYPAAKDVLTTLVYHLDILFSFFADNMTQEDRCFQFISDDFDTIQLEKDAQFEDAAPIENELSTLGQVFFNSAGAILCDRDNVLQPVDIPDYRFTYYKTTITPAQVLSALDPLKRLVIHPESIPIHTDMYNVILTLEYKAIDVLNDYDSVMIIDDDRFEKKAS